MKMSSKYAGVTLLLVLMAAFMFPVSAMAAATVSGKVINGLTGAGVPDVYLEISSQVKYFGNAFSKTDGTYTITFNPGTSTVFTITCFASGYLPGQLNNVTEGAGKDITILPVGISYPAQPHAISSPKSLYVEWPANPEHNLAGYYVYRYPCNADGSNIGAEVPLNGGAILTTNEIVDNSTALIAGQYYTYRVKAENTGGRVSEYSEYSAPRKGRFLTIFMPDVTYSPSYAGLYLWEQTDGGMDWLRIPISSDCAYSLSTSATQIVATFPTDLVTIDNISQIKVLPTGITGGMQFRAFVDTPGTLKIAGIATEGVQLYGSGSLFDVWVHPKNVTGTADLLLKRDGGQADPGVRIYEYLTTPDPANPLNYERMLVYPNEYELVDGSLDTTAACRHGDVNNDQQITQADVELAMEIGLGVSTWPNDPCYPKAANINNDDYVDQADAVQISRWLKGHEEGRGPEYFNPTPATAKGQDLDSLSYSQIDSKATNYVSVGSLKGSRNMEVEVPLYFTTTGDYSPLAGFSAIVGFIAGPNGASFVRARLGESLTGKYTFIAAEGSAVPGQDATTGSVRIAASGADSLGTKNETVILAYLTFKIGSKAAENHALAIQINAFSSSDPFGQTPKYGAPGQVKVAGVFADIEGELEGDDIEGDVIPQDGEPVVIVNEGEVDLGAVTEGEGEGDAAPEETTGCVGAMTMPGGGSNGMGSMLLLLGAVSFISFGLRLHTRKVM